MQNIWYNFRNFVGMFGGKWIDKKVNENLFCIKLGNKYILVLIFVCLLEVIFIVD